MIRLSAHALAKKTESGLIDSDKRINFNTHQREKELSHREKDTDKNNTNGVYVAVCDLQAVTPAPGCLISSFYYKSKMKCYNFTISDSSAKNVKCYFWNETESKR